MGALLFLPCGVAAREPVKGATSKMAVKAGEVDAAASAYFPLASAS